MVRVHAETFAAFENAGKTFYGQKPSLMMLEKRTQLLESLRELGREVDLLHMRGDADVGGRSAWCLSARTLPESDPLVLGPLRRVGRLARSRVAQLRERARRTPEARSCTCVAIKGVSLLHRRSAPTTSAQVSGRGTIRLVSVYAMLRLVARPGDMAIEERTNPFAATHHDTRLVLTTHARTVRGCNLHLRQQTARCISQDDEAFPRRTA